MHVVIPTIRRKWKINQSKPILKKKKGKNSNQYADNSISDNTFYCKTGIHPQISQSALVHNPDQEIIHIIPGLLSAEKKILIKCHSSVAFKSTSIKLRNLLEACKITIAKSTPERMGSGVLKLIKGKNIFHLYNWETRPRFV